MAELPDDVIEGTPEEADVSIRLYTSKERTLEIAQSLKALLDTQKYLECSYGLASSHGYRLVHIHLASDRTGVVCPALDALTERLREHHGDADPRVRIPGFTRCFYGYEHDIWTKDGKL